MEREHRWRDVGLGVLLGVVLATASLVGLWWRDGRSVALDIALPARHESAPPDVRPPLEAALFLPAAGGEQLAPTTRRLVGLEVGRPLAEVVERLVGEVWREVAGEAPGRSAPPRWVRQAYLIEPSPAWLVVDLDEGAAAPQWGDLQQEARFLDALVHTLLAGAPAAEAVVFLVGGRPHPSWTGHIDTERPLTWKTELAGPRPRRGD